MMLSSHIFLAAEKLLNNGRDFGGGSVLHRIEPVHFPPGIPSAFDAGVRLSVSVSSFGLHSVKLRLVCSQVSQHDLCSIYTLFRICEMRM